MIEHNHRRKDDKVEHHRKEDNVDYTPVDIKYKNNIIDFLNGFETKHRAFISLFLRPLFMLLIFLSVGYYTMWLSSTYVRQSDFKIWIETQISQDAKQDNTAESRFEIIKTKLDALINQQIAYNEQLKSINQFLVSQQKQIDALNERLIYLERNAQKFHPNKTP